MHKSVLLEETIDLLNIQEKGTYLDVTAGDGGHSKKILERLKGQGRLILTDCDKQAIERVSKKFSEDKRCVIFQARFSEVFDILSQKGLLPVHGIIADLGISSFQIEDPTCGLSFMSDGPLDMRMDQRITSNAFDLIATLNENEMADVFFNYGEERYSRKIARAVKYDFDRGLIQTTKDLKELAERVLGRFYKKQKIHPATRIFQALRIAVNDELKELDILLNQMAPCLIKNGRAALISFHSLEDRRVKQKFKDLKNQGWRWVTKKPVVPSKSEVADNPRSRSAKLRVIEKEC